MSKTIDKWTTEKGTYELLEEEGFPSSRELFLDGQMIMSDEQEIEALYSRLAQLAKERKDKALLDD